MMAAIVTPLDCRSIATTASCLLALRATSLAALPLLRWPLPRAGLLDLEILFWVMVGILCSWTAASACRHHRSPTAATSPAGRDPGQTAPGTAAVPRRSGTNASPFCDHLFAKLPRRSTFP